MTRLDNLATALATARRKGFRGGTDRTVTPAETLSRITPLMDRLGVTRLANVTGLDVIGIPVAVAVRPNSRSLSTSQGKGLTLDAAKASALMEATELFHAESATLALKFNSFADLDATGHAIVAVDGLPKAPRHSFDAHQAMFWVEALDLVGGARRWLPFELVHTNYTLPAVLSTGTFHATSNGLASGNDLLEAVLHGIYEVVERDATTLWVLSETDAQAARRVDLTTVDDEANTDLLLKFEAAGVAVAVWNTTTDVGLASFLCMIADTQQSRLQPIHAGSGMGCHVDRRVALSRALTEAAQSRLTVTTGSRDDVPRDVYRPVDATYGPGAVLDRALAHGLGRVDFQDVPTFENDTFNEDLDLVLARLSAAGVTEVMVVNLERNDLGVAVVRVVIPGLEGMIESADYVCGARAHRQLGV